MPDTDEARGGVRDRARGGSVARETAADVADDVRAVAEPYVADALGRMSFVVLAVLLVPVGIAIVAVGFVAMAVAYSLLGNPTGPLASAITIGGLVGILAGLFLAFRALYRRMPRRLRAAYAAPLERGSGPIPTAWLDNVGVAAAAPAADPGPRAAGRSAKAPTTPAPTLAELDARLAPAPLQRDPDDAV